MKTIIIGLLSLIGLLITGCQQPTAYVDTYQLFENFQGKKELEKRQIKRSQQKQLLLDSMKIQLMRLEQSQTATEYDLKQQQQQYNHQANKFHQELEKQTMAHTEEIWKQINQYTFEYGEEQGYDYIFGTASNGSLMYANKGKDITKEVLNYINNKYEGH